MFGAYDVVICRSTFCSNYLQQVLVRNRDVIGAWRRCSPQRANSARKHWSDDPPPDSVSIYILNMRPPLLMRTLSRYTEFGPNKTVKTWPVESTRLEHLIMNAFDHAVALFCTHLRLWALSYFEADVSFLMLSFFAIFKGLDHQPTSWYK